MSSSVRSDGQHSSVDGQGVFAHDREDFELVDFAGCGILVGGGHRRSVQSLREAAEFVRAGGIGVVVDMDDVTMRPLRDTVLKPDRQANDEDSVKQEYLTEWSFEIGQEKKHAIIRGITGY